MKLLRRIRQRIRWWRWFFGGPFIGDFVIGERYHRQAWKVAMKRWHAREPERT